MSGRQCKARSSRSGERCRRWAVKGAEVCATHGGSAPQVKRKAKERLALQKVATMLDGMERKTPDPLDELLRVVWEDSAMVSILGTAVAELETNAPGQTSIYGPDHLGDGRAHVLVTEYGRWVDRLAHHSKMAIDAGIAERQVKVAESQGRMLAEIVAAIIDDPDLGLELTQRELARKVAGRHLRAVS